MSHPENHEKRLIELLVSEQFGELSTPERDELEELLEARSVESIPIPSVLGELLVLLDTVQRDGEQIPTDLADRVVKTGDAIVGNAQRSLIEKSPANDSGSIRIDQSSVPNRGPGLQQWGAGLAAVIALGAVLWGAYSWNALRAVREQQVTRMAAMQEQLSENQTILEQSEAAMVRMESELTDIEADVRSKDQQLAAALRDKIELANRLAEATTGLENAERRIALYEEPLDPIELADRRQQLTEVPDAIQIAWQPFDLPDAPAEQRQVRGDVVWSDSEQRGYIRFVGLSVNDPDIEQYQVWVIDERGLEQKVSGGVFNVSDEGEIIVPIKPGIDVGRVALFAVTVENPGGTWVPDLSRRVVVAPRQAG